MPGMLREFFFVLIGAVSVLALPAAPLRAAPTDAERAEICAEADTRYQQVFGKARKDEPVKTVVMYKDVFCPTSLTVIRGETVRWINLDKRTSHSVWFRDAGKDESERIFSEEKVEMTFDFPPGEYPYLCGPHWESAGMIGKVTVKEKSP